MKTSLLFSLLPLSAAAVSLHAQTVFTLPGTPTIGQPIVGGSSGRPFVLVQPNAVQITPVANGFITPQIGGVTVGAGQGNTGATPLVNLQLQFGTNPLIPTASANGFPNGVSSAIPSHHVGRGNFPPSTVFPGQNFTGSVGYAAAVAPL